MIGIYKITNMVNGKSYIGQSTDIKRRWSEHRRNSSGSDAPIYRAFNKHGLENFSFEVLEICLTSELDDREIFFIDYYESLTQGYNAAKGGSGTIYRKLSIDDIEEITNLLRGDSSIVEIASIYSVMPRTISRINVGKSHIRDIKYPIREYSPGRVKASIQRYCSYCSIHISDGANTCIECYQNNRGKKCSSCGIKIDYRATKCATCNGKSKRKVERPSKEDLLEMVAKSGFAQVGRKYGVSGTLVTYWCKSYGLPTKKKDIVNLYKSL